MRPAVFATPPFTLAAVAAPELPAVNAVIERAIAGWRLSERIKRLMLPSYRYDTADLCHFELLAARVHGVIVGVAAWEQAAGQAVPAGLRGLLLHGLYVDPPWQGRGVGRALFRAVCEAAKQAGLHGVLIKARPEAAEFFAAQGAVPLSLQDPQRDYPHRFWRAVQAGSSTWC